MRWKLERKQTQWLINCGMRNETLAETLRRGGGESLIADFGLRIRLRASRLQRDRLRIFYKSGLSVETGAFA
jgi:hypothetical protein